MLATVSVNWWAIVIAAIINMVLGMVWYSPLLFGKSWMKLMGIKEMKPNPLNLLGMFVIALVIGYIFRFFIGWAGANTVGLGVDVGVLAGLAFTVLPVASGVFASGTSWKLWAINAGYWIVALAIIGAILARLV